MRPLRKTRSALCANAPLGESARARASAAPIRMVCPAIEGLLTASGSGQDAGGGQPHFAAGAERELARDLDRLKRGDRRRRAGRLDQHSAEELVRDAAELAR